MTKKYINVRISQKAYRVLSRTAKKEGRTIIKTLDQLLGV